MKKYLVFGLFGALLGLPLLAQPSIVLCDSATEDFLRIDISTLITRNGTDTPASAFEQVEQSDDHGLVFRAHTLTAQALGKCGYSWENGDYMAHSCLDFPFPVIDRTDGDSIILEFDALWDIRKGSGEAGRLVAFLMHEYPAEGPGLDDLLITSGHPFGRPAYNIRILNGSYAGFMGYGGGSDIEGTFEIYQESYWLPGFSARAGGGTYGEGENYPVNSFMEAVEGSPTTSDSKWMHYTWVLDPERQSLYMRYSDENEEENTRVFFMEMPENGNLSVINQAHGSSAINPPPSYNWFPEINGLRFYWRGVNNFYLANIVLKKTGVPFATYVEFQRDKYKVKESAGSYELALLMQNPVEGEDTEARIDLVAGPGEAIGGFQSEAVVFPADDRGVKILSLDISSDEDELNDTLLFEIKEVTGGRYPVPGPKREFTLIINDDLGTALNQERLSRIKIWPNPAAGEIRLAGLPGGSVLYTLYSLSGRMLDHGELMDRHLSVSGLDPGLYLLQLRFGQEQLMKKVIIKD